MVKVDFSIFGHARFLDGYLDAMGRSLTTDSELVAFSCFSIGEVENVEELFQQKEADVLVEGWSAEFCGFVNNSSALARVLAWVSTWLIICAGSRISLKVPCPIAAMPLLN